MKRVDRKQPKTNSLFQTTEKVETKPPLSYIPLSTLLSLAARKSVFLEIKKSRTKETKRHLIANMHNQRETMRDKSYHHGFHARATTRLIYL